MSKKPPLSKGEKSAIYAFCALGVYLILLLINGWL